MGSLKERKVAKIQSEFVQQHEYSQQLHTKKKRGLFRRLAVFGIGACILSAFAISTLFSQSAAIDKKLEEKQQVEKKLADLKKQKQSLEEEIVKLNDDDYIAKIARRDYYLSQKGEVILNLPKKEDGSD
ncbi:FtsB family cell division protein [Bacillus testis]|uniref:FtsB family cell division protein n=1 Tax=Bacillus testis TaxID=1622072 RepID=UPI00067F305D|nr:septum formation initiator family protein [Bacillus testis]